MRRKSLTESALCLSPLRVAITPSASTAALLLAVSTTSAAITVPTVTVGDAGNIADDTGFGSVAYEYRIGTHEVTTSRGRLRGLTRREGRVIFHFMNSFTAVIKQSDEWWIGWIEELPGINCQGRTREELTENLSSALREAIEMHREEAIAAAEGDYQEQTLVL